MKTSCSQRRGIINKNILTNICNNLRNPERRHLAAAFMAGMFITAALALFGLGTGDLPAADDSKNIMHEQQNTPGLSVPDKYPEISPDEYMNYELVYALVNRALIFS
jgi:hypothetical protein